MDRARSATGSGHRGGRVAAALAVAVAVALVIGVVLAPTVGAQEARPAPQSRGADLPKATMTVGGEELTVELATKPAAKRRGLGGRARLAPGTGMLFVEAAATPQTFWMKGMRFCIDIVWIEGGQIVGAAERACPDAAGTSDEARRRYRSPGPVRYVLEVPSGWLAANGLGVGSPVTLPRTVG